ncbi:MAG: hypothetical protein AAF696_29985 [Bacteroidota bacterium]
MNKRNTYLLIAGILNLATAMIHLFAGQIDLIHPLMESELDIQIRTELLGAWHIVSVVLLGSSYMLIRQGLGSLQNQLLSKTIAWAYILFSIVFILSSLYTHTFAPQWILLLPIGILVLLGVKHGDGKKPFQSFLQF